MVSSGGAGSPGEFEEPRSGPGRAGDLPGDAGQRSIEFPLELETLFGDDHRVGSSMPFSDKARSRFDPRLSRGCDPPIALELGGENSPNAARSPSTGAPLATVKTGEATKSKLVSLGRGFSSLPRNRGRGCGARGRAGAGLVSGPLRRDDADLGQVAAQPIEQLRALRDQHLPRLVAHQRRLILQRAQAHKPHRRPRHRLANRRRVSASFFCRRSCREDYRLR